MGAIQSAVNQTLGVGAAAAYAANKSIESSVGKEAEASIAGVKELEQPRIEALSEKQGELSEMLGKTRSAKKKDLIKVQMEANRQALVESRANVFQAEQLRKRMGSIAGKYSVRKEADELLMKSV